MMSFPSKEMTEALVALHNLGVALEKSKDLDAGAVGFPTNYRTPTTYVARRLQDLATELCLMVEDATDAQAKAEGIR